MQKSSSRNVLAICLGQLLSLCITGTSSVSSALWKHYSINIPFTQNFCNYLLLAIVYRLIYGHRQPNGNSTRILGFSVADVQANVLVVLAFKNTSLLSVLLLSAWTTPCIMLLSTYFLHAHYSKTHIQSAVLCMIGLIVLVYSDTIHPTQVGTSPTGKKPSQLSLHL
ncbi:solute carrier family 35 member SLC35F1/F2/F6 [Mycotypha africana]|uniref:solute carrier family 35 member SLC35F1/F2/F6 n=1 Tax=Mycotypha africana TaxID=64632 RepID=UPI0023014FCA|nr:solute carrier family 35 member SLC35F1/F2/F6 [Mycotypha africana]KAI8979734.1 solute carrier family 35 member SLC35F1/F2/F6 [Mycotypha africana]